MAAIPKYSPPHYSGAVHIVYCSGSNDSKEKDELQQAAYENWKQFAPSTEVASISASHYNCMKEPFVQELASEISKVMCVATFKTTSAP